VQQPVDASANRKRVAALRSCWNEAKTGQTLNVGNQHKAERGWEAANRQSSCRVILPLRGAECTVIDIDIYSRLSVIVKALDSILEMVTTKNKIKQNYSSLRQANLVVLCVTLDFQLLLLEVFHEAD
jgi:hypothetical protein